MKDTLTLLTALLLSPLTAIHAAEISPNKLTPEESQRFRSAAKYSRAAHGVSVLVMRRGEIVFEDYAPGWRDKPHELASGTKSFSGVMAVCAAQDGPLMLDEKVSDSLTEWKSDPRKSQATIRQLLSLSSGILSGSNRSIMLLGGRETGVPHDDFESLGGNAEVDQSLSTATTNVVSARKLLSLTGALVSMLNNHTGLFADATDEPTDTFDRESLDHPRHRGT